MRTNSLPPRKKLDAQSPANVAIGFFNTRRQVKSAITPVPDFSVIDAPRRQHKAGRIQSVGQRDCLAQQLHDLLDGGAEFGWRRPGVSESSLDSWCKVLRSALEFSNLRDRCLIVDWKLPIQCEQCHYQLIHGASETGDGLGRYLSERQLLAQTPSV